MHAPVGRQDGWRTIGALAVAVLFALPLLLMVSGSLRPAGTAAPPTPELLPSPASIDSYRVAVGSAASAGRCWSRWGPRHWRCR